MAMSTHSHRPAGPPPQSSMLPSEGVTIGELARLTGFNTKAIRYYESMGILPPSTRSENGYRRYSQADVNRLYLLRRLRLLGISLTEAKALLNATLGALCRDVQGDLLHLGGAPVRAGSGNCGIASSPQGTPVLSAAIGQPRGGQG